MFQCKTIKAIVLDGYNCFAQYVVVTILQLFLHVMSGKGKHLSESQRLEVIIKLSDTATTSMRSLALKYEVSEGAIQKIWENS